MAQPASPPVTRYHPAITLLHWVMTVLIIGSLGIGFFRLEPMANADPQKIGLLRIHMIVGITILILMAIRLVVRLFSSKPSAASADHPALDQFATLAHYAFYVLVALMAATGISTAVLSGLGPIVFGSSGAALPPSFLIYPARVAHGTIAIPLVALIGLHIVAAFYHQLFLGDGVFRRIWFGARR
jgi:cytochrome b561